MIGHYPLCLYRFCLSKYLFLYIKINFATARTSLFPSPMQIKLHTICSEKSNVFTTKKMSKIIIYLLFLLDWWIDGLTFNSTWLDECCLIHTLVGARSPKGPWVLHTPILLSYLRKKESEYNSLQKSMNVIFFFYIFRLHVVQHHTCFACWT